MPQFDASTFLSQIFWLMISFGALYALVSYVFLPRISTVLKNRVDVIDDEIQKALSYQDEMRELTDQFESILNASKQQAVDVLKETYDKVNAERVKHEKEINLQMQDELKKAEHKIENLYKKHLEEADQHIIETCFMMVNKLSDQDIKKSDIEKQFKKSKKVS